jgi:hypothetical protein
MPSMGDEHSVISFLRAERLEFSSLRHAKFSTVVLLRFLLSEAKALLNRFPRTLSTVAVPADTVHDDSTEATKASAASALLASPSASAAPLTDAAPRATAAPAATGLAPTEQKDKEVQRKEHSQEGPLSMEVDSENPVQQLSASVAAADAAGMEVVGERADQDTTEQRCSNLVLSLSPATTHAAFSGAASMEESDTTPSANPPPPSVAVAVRPVSTPPRLAIDVGK